MPQFRVDKHGDVHVWTIEGEARRNAISRAMLSELRALVSGAPAAGARAVILTGAGAQAFCAGADLKERAGMTPDEVRAFLEGLRALLCDLEASDSIFIAALNGVALGGGLELALACDLRVAAPEAAVGLTEVKLGIIPGGGGTQRLARIVGRGAAKDLILTGRKCGAGEALALGLVNRVAAPGKLLEEALSLAQTIAENAPLALSAAKHAVDQGAEVPLEAGLQLEHRFYERVLASEDRLEGLKAFAEKRKPVFRGR